MDYIFWGLWQSGKHATPDGLLLLNLAFMQMICCEKVPRPFQNKNTKTTNGVVAASKRESYIQVFSFILEKKKELKQILTVIAVL